jgi:hypothetical protein
MPHISFKLVKSRIKNIQRFKQGACWCKMAGAWFHYFAKIRAQICNAVKADRGIHSADCQCKNRRTADWSGSLIWERNATGLAVPQFLIELRQSGVKSLQALAVRRVKGRSPDSIESEYCYKSRSCSKSGSDAGSCSNSRSGSDSRSGSGSESRFVNGFGASPWSITWFVLGSGFVTGSSFETGSGVLTQVSYIFDARIYLCTTDTQSNA